MNDFASWEAFSAWLEGLGMFHMELGLERMERLLSALNLGQPPFPVFQVLGTNGKGSCATFLAALASAHKLRCGLFLSPHFLSIEERIKIDARPAARAQWLECANIIKKSMPKGLSLTYFEFLTLLALLLFTRAKVDVAVFEAGLGGRNDATSAIPAQWHCLTPIAMDHAHIIGPRLEDIARDKADAIKPLAHVFSARQSPPVLAVLSAACGSQRASLDVIETDPALPPLRLGGETQKSNASLALKAWRAFAHELGAGSSPERERQALGRAFIPGRLQFIDAFDDLPPLLLDGAHNPHAMRALLNNLDLDKVGAIIFSALADKDWRTNLELMNVFPESIPMFVPALNNARAASAEEIAACRNRRRPASSFALSGEHALPRALDKAAEICRRNGKGVLLTGSLYLLADFFKLYPQYLEADQSFHAISKS